MGVRTRLLSAVLLLASVRTGRAADLTVLAAASLTDVLREAAHVYREAHVTVSAGSSGDLARQISAGAPADVFFSADARRMDELERDGLLLPGERHDLLSNVLVVVVPLDSPTTVRDAAALLALRRLAVADPETVPAGAYARTWLESRGLWQRLADRVVPAIDVRATLAAVAAEHVEAGIVYRTDARIEPRVRVAFEVPAAEGPHIVYSLAPLAASPRPDQARALVRWLAGPEARSIYERHGFLVRREA
jgi:molybdate transport system substrate-binding protein